ncbi:uncharacterized protein N7515_001697 [Penicillium bovifimosum]|uniref:N-acetyltransferase domain-containing protein n=1 Tax=Penicillium bovifimosum TaxID=126998 RepID=A0A9W9HA82_9EURO|nr:uncharacterized protein N7515_001697 [Penicillium bovifimosum]KAJ5142910.1 hypothetical protein N7515_001697 [Penicillium bovifimosum]
MLLNANTALASFKALLVPYSSWHVPRYHEWMQDPEIQEATASEPLTLEEEYSMQRSWRQDPDKLTFIICRALNDSIPSQSQLQPDSDSPSNMVGDINLFLRVDDGEEGDDEPQIIGEIELMIAEKANQRRGFGRAALLMFLRYIVANEEAILEEFVGGAGLGVECVRRLRDGGLGVACFSVKIGKENVRSLALFESVGFEKVSEEANFFGEFELRMGVLQAEGVDRLLGMAGMDGVVELAYKRVE